MIKLAAIALLALGGCASLPASNPEPLVLTFQGGSCSGTAIRLHVILTATHCLKGGAIAADGGPLTVKRRIDDGNDHTLLIVAQAFDARAVIANMPTQGERICITANPAGLRAMYASGTVAGEYQGDTLLNLPIFFGDSGAAVLDDQGRIVGVVSAVRVLARGDVSVSWGEAKPFRFTVAQWRAAGVE
jgi:hypothetical protein